MSEDTRQSMIRAAWALVAERGLGGMSTREVLARTGAPRGSVYHYFPRGRAELLECALDQSRQWTREQTETISSDDLPAVVRGYFDVWRRVLLATDYRAGCPVAGVVTGAPDDALRQRGARSFTAATDALTDKLREAGLPPGRARERATILVCVAEGAVLLARAQLSIQPLDDVQAVLERDWSH